MNKLLLALALILPISIASVDVSAQPSQDAGAALLLDAGSAAAPVTGSGTAPVTPVVIDPSHLQQSASDAWAAWEHFGIVWGSMMVLFGVGTLIVKKNDETHWLSQGRTLPIAVGVLGTIGSAIDAKFNGGNWTAVLSTLMATGALIIQKPVPGTMMKAPPGPTAA